MLWDTLNSVLHTYYLTSPVAQTVRASAYSVGDLGSIPGLGRSPGEGNGNPLQCSCLENPTDGRAMDGGAFRLQAMGSQRVGHDWSDLAGAAAVAAYIPCCCLVAKLCPTLLGPHGPQPIRLLCPVDSPSKNSGVGCHFLLQRTFPTQGSNPSLLHW